MEVGGGRWLLTSRPEHGIEKKGGVISSAIIWVYLKYYFILWARSAGVAECMHAAACFYKSKKTCRSLFFLSAIWTPGIEYKLSSLVASSLKSLSRLTGLSICFLDKTSSRPSWPQTFYYYFYCCYFYCYYYICLSFVCTYMYIT